MTPAASASPVPASPAPASPAPASPVRRIARRLARMPRRTVRLRLTLVFGGMFLVAGTGLIAITYVLVANRLPVVATSRGHASNAVQHGQRAMVCISVQRPPATLLPVPAPSCAQVAQFARQQRDAELRQLLTESGIALGITTAASIGLGWLVAGRVLRPLRTITATARSVSASSLHARLAMTGPDDELKELGDTFDGLLARLEAAFEAQRQFVANASHELRTPLTRQRTLIEVALADPGSPVSALRETCRRVLATGEEQERLIEALLTLARSQRGLDRRDPVDLAALVGEVVIARRPEAAAHAVIVRAELASATTAGDAGLAERLVANLVDNAIRHNLTGGTVDVSTGCVAGRCVLAVSNTGPVVARDDVARLFQPFQCGGRGETARGDPARAGRRDGLGLGLSIVAAIAQAHGAWLHASALPGGGLSVQVGFPPAALRAGAPADSHRTAAWNGAATPPVPAAGR